jgi:hypothetical protein
MSRPDKVPTGAFNFTPGPNGEVRNRLPKGGPGYPWMKMTGGNTGSMEQAAPVQQFTPDQLWFRSSLAQGRWPTDFDAGAAAPANLIRQDSDGVTDLSQLEAVYNPNGGDQYVDLGGKGGVDFGVGKP